VSSADATTLSSSIGQSCLSYPPGAHVAPLPETDRFQSVEIVSLQVPGKQRMVHDRKNSNRILVLDLAPEDSGKTIDIRFAVRRIEKAAYEASKPGESYLAPDRLVPITEEFRTTARNVVSGKKEDLVRAGRSTIM